MSNETVPGRRYRVTAVVEGVADTHGNVIVPLTDQHDRVYWAASLGQLRVSAGATTVEEIKPTYIEGRLYRDADGDVVLRAAETDDSIRSNQPWIYLGSNGVSAGARWGANIPTEPLVELELKEKQ